MLKRMATAVLAVVLVSMGPASAAESGHGEGIRVVDAYARATPPGVPNGAVFLTLENTAAEMRRLVGVRSAAAARAELHGHRQENGVVRMRQLQAVELPPGEQVVLEPGGRHIMLMGLQSRLSPGGDLPLVLMLDNGDTLTLRVPVHDLRYGGGSGHKH